MERSDAQRLNEEYRNLVQGLRASGVLGGGSRGGGGPAEAKSGAPDASDQVISAPVLDADILREAMPGNIRRARHFVRFLHTVLEYLRQFLRRKEVTRMTPADFVSQLQKETGLADARALRFTYDRLSSLLKTLQVTDIDEFTPVTMVANFATLVATYSKVGCARRARPFCLLYCVDSAAHSCCAAQGFTVLFEPYDDRTQQISDPILQLACLDSALAMRPVFGRFRNVIITSGTLSPLDFYPKILGFRPKVGEAAAG
jgi:DNA excision repair protein ERCC-2